MTKSTKLSLEFAVYAVMLVVVSLFIYVLNDDNQPLIGILRPGYLIPCVIYASIVVLISFALFKAIKTIAQKRWFALGIAVIIGIPAGIYILFNLTNWIFKH